MVTKVLCIFICSIFLQLIQCYKKDKKPKSSFNGVIDYRVIMVSL